MDAITMLEEDHKGAKKVIDDIATCSGAKRKELFAALQGALATHDWIEETIFYPAVKGNPKTAAFPSADKKAHEVVEAALARLDKLSVDDAAWIVQFNAMKSKLLQHVADEEKDLFPKIRATLSSKELMDLGDKLKAGKELRSKAGSAA
jgi:iron-sulfur cluster repair protein YtfE (RIC family)